MNKPELYVKNNHLAREFAAYVLSKHTSLLEATENHAVIDVGCGPGDITFEKILPLLSKTTKKLIGVDVSPVQVEYARSHFGEDPRISYQELDVTTDSLPKYFTGTFDLVISLLCLHFIDDRRKAISNIRNLLKPNGKLLISLMGKTIMPQIYQSVYDDPKWTRYLTNFERHFVTQPAQYYNDLLGEMGFDNVEIEEMKMVYTCPESEMFDVLTAVNIFNVPDDLMKQYVQDQINYFFKSGLSSLNANGQRLCHKPITILIISAVKSGT